MLRQRLPFWFKEANRTLAPRPGREATAVAVMAAVLEALGFDPAQSLLAPSQEPVETRLRKAVDLQLSHYRKALAGQTAIVFWVFEDFLSNTQQTEVARDILDDGRYPVVFLITNRWRSLDEFHVEDVFCGHQPLYIPDRNLLSRIDFASVFWAIDCLYNTELPPGSVRLLQPHGTDILFQYSVDFYGAGLLFDYLLSPSFSPEMFREDYLEHYDGVLPHCLADHDNPSLHAINVGSFKLDQFARRCQRGTPSDIIYNLSSWDLEHAEVKHGLTTTLEEILRRHPDRRLVFRCFPGDEDTVRPHLAPLLYHPRFFWSTAPTYLDDYADGAVLIHHRGSSAEIFSVASGRPSIKLDYFAPYSAQPVETPVGRMVHDRDQLWTALADFALPDTYKHLEILAFRAGKYPALGQGLRLVLDSIPRMLARRAAPEWRTLPLAETPAGVTDQDFVRTALAKALKRDILIPILAERAAVLLPDSALAHFYAAKAIITHIYPDPSLDGDTWLTAAEHLAEYHRLQPKSDVPKELEPAIRDWMSRFLPARLIGLMGWSVHHHDAQQRERLAQAFHTLPLKFFDTEGIPQWMEETARLDGRRQDHSREELQRAKQLLRELSPSQARKRFLVSPLMLDDPQGPDADPVYLADPFLSQRARWDKRLAAAPAAPWRLAAPEALSALNDTLRRAAEKITAELTAGLEALHPGGPRGTRFWVKALGMGIVDLTHLLWDFFDLFEREFSPERHDAILLDPAGYHVPLDFDDLRWLLQHSDFGMEQAFSLYVRALQPDAPCRFHLLRHDNQYRVRSVGAPTLHNPVVGILGSFPAPPYREALISDSGGDIEQIGFRRELDLYATPADLPRRLDLCAGGGSADRFTQYLQACLPWLLPKSMLENFLALERSIERDLAPHTRLAHVLSEFWVGESYECLALAVLSRRGVQHIYNEHVMSCAPFLAAPLHEQLAVCDIYAGCSTLEQPDLPRYLAAGSLFDFAATRPEAKPPRRCTYFSAKPFARSTAHGGVECAVARGPWALPYYEWKQRLFSRLPAVVKNGLVYRRYPYDDFFKLANLAWDDEAMMDGLLDGCLLDDHSYAAREAIQASEIVLTDQLSTTFVEAVALERPTVLLLHSTDIFAARYVPVMEQLLRCGMVQSDPDAAAAFLERIWDDPLAWWDSEELRMARQLVLDVFMGRPERLLELLLDLAKGQELPPPPKAPLGEFLCPNPFLYAELRPGGDVAPCCYLDLSFGNIHDTALDEIWNSPRAQSLRASILDGSYRHCDASRCAGMQKALLEARGGTPPARYQLPYELHRREELRGTQYSWIEAWMPETSAPLPGIISLEDDPSCNLSCPSCRTAPRALPSEDSARLEPMHAGIVRLLDEKGGELWICGAGDPFASRAYLKLLLEFDPATHPDVRFRIDTNGQLLTPGMWDKTLGRYPERISLLAVSVDAADSATYARLRRGGDWERLERNLAFLGGKRLEHPGLRLILRMIVQKDNFRQMPAFVDLARRVHADRAVFSALENWGSLIAEDWEAMAVHRPENPHFGELLRLLREPALHAEDVDLGNLTALLPHAHSVAKETASGPEPCAQGLPEKRALAIAFHLPQFHPIPENDAWWGKGFTEWTNTAKALPLFEGHYQPHVPADLGFYDLRLPEARAAQARMAAEYGVDAFLYWHYWFGNGRRLLERPVDEIVRSGQPDFPFCLGWANQTWSGIWHGAPQRVLMEQHYPGLDDYRAHFEALLPAFADPRYLKIEGRNLFLVYNPSGLPDATAFAECWRGLARAHGLPDFHFVEHGGSDWVGRGFDTCVANAPFINFNGQMADVHFHDPGQAPTVREYADYVCHMARQKLGPREHPLGVNAWDNTPRSGGKGHALHGSTPELFAEHLEDLLQKIASRPKASRILFLKSWNEWAEGNHLEPDIRWGCRYLEVLRDSLYSKPRP